jgi:transcriptional regulator with XRE-family HTH domain
MGDSENILKRFGKNLEKIKKAKKMSYRKIAANCDLEHSDIKRYVDGKTNPTLLSIIDLAKGLNIHPRELLEF